MNRALDRRQLAARWFLGRARADGFVPGVATGAGGAAALAVLLLGLPSSSPAPQPPAAPAAAPVPDPRPWESPVPLPVRDPRLLLQETPSPEGHEDAEVSGDDEAGTDAGSAGLAPRGAPAPELVWLPSGRPADCPSATVTVADAAELHAALATARPGEAIRLRDGTYRGSFVATASGTGLEPIWLCGGPAAVLDGGGLEEGYVVHLDGARHWRLVGFTVRNGQKGVMADGTHGSVIQSLTVEDIGDEGIHLRSASTSNAVLDNVIRRTGLRKEKFGEGVYVGSARSNWEAYGGGGPDRSDDNLIQGNRISQTTSESVDIKEGTTGGRLVGNVFDGAGMVAADSWVDVKGNEWLIEGNIGHNSPLDGFQTHEILDGWGTRNVFRANTADIGPGGTAVHLTPVRDNVACGTRTGDSRPALVDPACAT